MTRAKDLLSLTGHVKDYEKSKEKWSDTLGASSYLDRIMPCILDSPDKAEKLIKIRVHSVEDTRCAPPNILKPSLQKDFETEEVQPRETETAFPLPSKLSISEIKRLYDITPDSSFREDFAPVFMPPAFIKAESGITPMQMGSALHTVTEHIDYCLHTTTEAIDELIVSLIEKNLLTPEEATAIGRDKIKKLANSPLAKRLRNAAASSKLFRETPFVLALPAAQLYPDLDMVHNDTILVHGIIDCHFEENGKIVLLDFKSDNIPHPTTLNEWAENHRVQLEIYKQALEKSTEAEVSEILLYSFARDETAILKPL
jgi:ATP-dependent helicase/nuclease subunit A